MPAHLISRLQSVQNAAARLIFQIRRSEHITDAFLELHWLPIPERIVYKLAVQTYRALNGSAPRYLSSQLTRVADMLSRLRLRSASTKSRPGSFEISPMSYHRTKTREEVTGETNEILFYL